ncbi:MAG: methylamine utilization protein MauE [Gammaproteobacteria bacterium]|nr:methylamine utilization protein MauE [Gammaproteobacteria bacterium]
MDPVIANASSLLLAGVFAGAALHKWWHAAEFRGVLADYRVIPAEWVNASSRLLPVLEFGAALGLAVPGTAFHAAVLAVVLLLVYSMAITVNLLHGRRELDCGCGGPPQPLSAALLLRNAVLVVFACAVGADRIERPLGILDWGITLLAAAAGVLFYLIINQLLANSDSLKVLKRRHA